MYRLCAVNNILQNRSGGLKQCIFFRKVANTVYSSLREKIFCLFLVDSPNMIFNTWMMDKHTEIIIWIVKDNIFLGHLTHLTNFHQYTVFATSRKKGRIVGLFGSLKQFDCLLYDIVYVPINNNNE